MLQWCRVCACMRCPCLPLQVHQGASEHVSARSVPCPKKAPERHQNWAAAQQTTHIPAHRGGHQERVVFAKNARGPKRAAGQAALAVGAQHQLLACVAGREAIACQVSQARVRYARELGRAGFGSALWATARAQQGGGSSSTSVPSWGMGRRCGGGGISAAQHGTAQHGTAQRTCNLGVGVIVHGTGGIGRRLVYLRGSKPAGKLDCNQREALQAGTAGDAPACPDPQQSRTHASVPQTCCTASAGPVPNRRHSCNPPCAGRGRQTPPMRTRCRPER